MKKQLYNIILIKNDSDDVVMLESNLELKIAYKKLLDEFNSIYSDELGYSKTWNSAVLKSRKIKYGAYKTSLDKTREFETAYGSYLVVEKEGGAEDVIYQVEVEFKVKGYFEFSAKDKEQAREYTEKHCGAIFDNYQSSLPDADWNFPIHPEKKIIKIKKL